MVQAPAEKPISQESGGVEQVVVPDTGNADGVTVIEVSIAVGDEVAEGDTIIVLESDKASMEIPSPVSGKVLAISVKEGDSVAQGDLIADVKATGGSTPQVTTTVTKTTAPAAVSGPAPAAKPPVAEETSVASVGSSVHAGPAVRALARELGVNLSNVASTGPRGRITKDDLHNFVKSRLKEVDSGQTASIGLGIPLFRHQILQPSVRWNGFR